MTNLEHIELRDNLEDVLDELAGQTLREEFHNVGYAPQIAVNELCIAIQQGNSPNYKIIPVPEIIYTYKVLWEKDNGDTISFFINDINKNFIQQMVQEAQETQESTSLLTEEEQALLDQAVEEAHQEIPVNSATLLVDETTSRFSSAIWYENIRNKTIIVAGCGGIGSWVIFLLARVRPASLFIYDDDVVEAANMSGQLYNQDDIDIPKVTAITNTANSYSNYLNIFAINEKYTSECEATDIMICGFDNMRARNTFFTNWLRHIESKSEKKRSTCLYLDGRLNAEEFQIFCIKGDDTYNIDRYKREFLFSDSEADATICSYKQTTFCASMIASYIVNLFVNFCANEVSGYRDLPFFTTYNAETMYLKTEA